jgi:hyperosmotically inducible periplasmic protein
VAALTISDDIKGGWILMKRIILVALCLAAAACDRSATKETGNGQETVRENPAAVNAEKPADNTEKSADNTQVNLRDRQPSALTPGDQGSSEFDRTITQHVRQGVVKDDELTMSAKNVKIITQEGVVTLRGPVKTDKEKAAIAGIAQRVAGVRRVDNQLEIAVN